jgi:hypothetical protein
LTKVNFPHSILTNLISTDNIDKEIIVFDGGAIDKPPILPPDEVIWQRIPVCIGKYILVQDEVDPYCGLTFQQIDSVLPFIRIPELNHLTYCLILGIKQLSMLQMPVKRLRERHW